MGKKLHYPLLGQYTIYEYTVYIYIYIYMLVTHVIFIKLSVCIPFSRYEEQSSASVDNLKM